MLFDKFNRAKSIINATNIFEQKHIHTYRSWYLICYSCPFYQILTCVNAILDTDKQIEPRRAAVTVIRQLFVGLETETIAFLKEDILPIYRTLKRIYRDDPDDVMRLQAQLALEELNENMKNLVFPKLELSAEKNVLHLK